MKEFKVNNNISHALIFYIVMWILFAAGSIFSILNGNKTMWILLLLASVLFVFILTINITIYPSIIYIDKQNISLTMYYNNNRKIILSKDKINTEYQKGIYILRYITENNMKKSYYIREKNISEELNNILSKMAGK